jgi:SAM-dependent MidA family methyltransferase
MTADGRASTIFPVLAPAEQGHSARVLDALRQEIAGRGGWIPFSDYQQRVLYAAGLGYYSAGAVKFGSGGDFVTAPEISPLFGRAAARWLAPLLADCGPEAGILELGAGSGALALQLLAELAAMGRAPASYSIVEVSADLRARQSAALTGAAASHGVPLRWLERLPEAFTGLILANEVLDALPCERFVQGPTGLLARGVTVGAAGELLDALRDPRAAPDIALTTAGSLRDCYADFQSRLQVSDCRLPQGYAGEFIPSLAPLMRSLSASLRLGALVLVDYGLPRRQLYLPERGAGTLRCIRRHHAHDDPYRDPGLTDITCWVDFTAVAEAAHDCGLSLRAFATQMGWMLDAGLESLLASAMAAAASDAGRIQLAQGVKTLLLPGEMGEAVKMMCLTRGLADELGRVGTQDLRASL